MRISDQMLSNRYLSNLNSSKAKLNKLQTQISTQKKINSPSDSPTGTSTLIRITDQIESTKTYINNINKSRTFLDDTLFVMDSMNSELTNIMVKLTELINPTNQGNLTLYSDQVDKSLNIILDLANIQSDGKYIFGGTDLSSAPFAKTEDGMNIDFASNMTGEQKIKISNNMTQQINVTGRDLFGTIISQSGNLDKSAAIGTVTSNSTEIFDVYGTGYSMNSSYTKTAENSYQFSYDILDADGNSIYTTPPTTKELVFNPSNGAMISMDGSSPSMLAIDVSEKKINFSVDFRGIKEKNEAASINSSVNQKTDIFNTLITLRENIKNGIIPDQAQIDVINNFARHLLDKISEVGSTINQLTNTEEMLNNQMDNFEELSASVNEVDLAKAILELQQQETALQFANKVASMILPRSILDYM
jgi:flagellar hook-associated protein 3 FlgL